MRYSKEIKQYHINQIRRVLVMNSNASVREIKELLEGLRNPLKLDKDYVYKLIKNIRKERAQRINYYTLNNKLSEFEDKISESDLRLWAIATSSGSNNLEKISALREMRNNNKDLFDKMFDAGVFEKQLGKVELTRAEVVKLIISDDNKKDELGQGSIGSSKEGSKKL